MRLALLLFAALVGCQCKREPKAEFVRRPLPPQQVQMHPLDAGVP